MVYAFKNKTKEAQCSSNNNSEHVRKGENRVTVLFNYCFEYQTILPFRKKIPKGILFLLRAHLSHFYFLLPNLTQLLKKYVLCYYLYSSWYLLPFSWIYIQHLTPLYYSPILSRFVFSFYRIQFGFWYVWH